ncbi:MAG: DUF6599 family protein [Candidatus Aminicenantales bacterium]
MIPRGRIKSFQKLFFYHVIIFGSFFFLLNKPDLAGDKKALEQLLPSFPDWFLDGEPDFYGPESLFEYINGASESYLAYDFKGLLVGQYSRQKETDPVLTVEIYDMRRIENAFGIYSAERPTEGNFVLCGAEGYLEQGALQFFQGRYYIKILCFLEGKAADDAAMLFGRELSKRIPEEKTWPRVLSLFPAAGRIAHSEKFILNNFLGFSYLRNGYLSSYQKAGLSFEVFIIPTKDAAEAEDLVSRLREDLADSQASPIVIDGTWRLESKYFQNIYISKARSYLFGLIRLAEAQDKLALEIIKELTASITGLKETLERE